MNTNTTYNMKETTLEEMDQDKKYIMSIFDGKPAKPFVDSKDEYRRILLNDYIRDKDAKTFCRRFNVANDFLKESLSDDDVEKYLPGSGWFYWMGELFDEREEMRTRLKNDLDEISRVLDLAINVYIARKIPYIEADAFQAANMIERRFHLKETTFASASFADWIKDHKYHFNALGKILENAIIRLINDINKAYNVDFVVVRELKRPLSWSVYKRNEVSPCTLFWDVATNISF